MFEALFILTTVDTGTRVARFAVGEFIGKAIPTFRRADWLPGAIVTTLLVVGGWSYFILTQGIDTIWPMFGIANQLLAVIALSVGTSVIINSGKARYAWVTAAPMVAIAFTTVTAGILKFDEFLERKATLNAALTGAMLVCTGGDPRERLVALARRLARGARGRARERIASPC